MRLRLHGYVASKNYVINYVIMIFLLEKKNVLFWGTFFGVFVSNQREEGKSGSRTIFQLRQLGSDPPARVTSNVRPREGMFHFCFAL